MTLAIDSLKQNLTNPARTYLWDVIIPNPVAGGDPETLMMRCQSTSIPGREVGTIPVEYKQSAGLRYSGKLRYSHTWDCTFIEGEDNQIFNTFYLWSQEIVHDRENTGAGDTAIKTDMYLSLVTSADEEYLKIKMIGCFPLVMAPVALAYNDEDIIRHAITFSYDRWEKV